jgi:hypothetical protein
MVSIIAYNHVKGREVEVRYAVDALLDRVGFRATWETSLEELQATEWLENSLLLVYGFDSDHESLHQPCINVHSCGFLERMYDCLGSVEEIRDSGLPLTELGTWQRRSATQIDFDQDLIASTFFCLSRYEEVCTSAEILDRHGRFPAEATRVAQAGALRRPLVDEYAAYLREAVHALVGDMATLPVLPSWFGRSFCVSVTHDIDTIYKYPPGEIPVRRLASLGIRYGYWESAVRTAAEFVRVRLGWQDDPYSYKMFRHLHEIEEQSGCRAAYYFLVGGNTFAESAPVDLSTTASQRALDFLNTEGHEIGFHPSYAASVDAKQFSQQLERLRSACRTPILGGRQHYLRFDMPFTWRLWEKNDLYYDSTLGFAEQPGFRCGTCFPFRPFDLVSRRVLDLWELPLTVMDRTLYDRHFCWMKPDDALQVICNLMDQVQALRGVFVMLWHPVLVDSLSGWPPVFRRVLEYANKQRAFIGPPRDVLQAWDAYRNGW